MASKKNTVEVVETPAAVLEAFYAEIQAVMAERVGDPTKVMEAQLTSILSADSFDDVIPSEDSSSATGLATIIGEPMKVTDIEFQASTIKGDGGLDYYAVLHTDTHGVVTTGSTQCVAQALKLCALVKAGKESFPFWVQGWETETNSGNTVRRLVKVSPERIAAAEARLARGQQMSLDDEPF